VTDDLLALAHAITILDDRRPRQAHLRRAVSTAYYALFHEMAGSCADSLVGGSGPNQTLRAWAQAYRALNHGNAKKACLAVASDPAYPSGIRAVASTFPGLQEARHVADYDPLHRLTRAATLVELERAETAVHALRETSATDRRAFAVRLLLPVRR